MSDIVSLDAREHVRLRSGMYIGDTSDATQLAIEIIGNAIDEFNAGFGDVICVSQKDDGTMTVSDHGRGFPIEMRDDGRSVLEAAFSVINTSGKFTNDGAYGGVSVGLNGIGGKATNFLSHELTARSVRGGRAETVHFTEGILDSREVTDAAGEHDGTTVTWRPSEEFFASPKCSMNRLKSFCEDLCCLCKGLVIDIGGVGRIEEPDGILGLLRLHQAIGEPIIATPFVMDDTAKDGVTSMSLGMTYTDGPSSSIVAYVNCGLTESGPHVTAIKGAITRTINKWAKASGIDANIDGPSLQEGMTLVCNLTARDVAYDAQVKSRVSKIDTAFFVKALSHDLYVWMDNHQMDAKAIIDKAVLARKASEAARKAREAARSKGTATKAFRMPSSLCDCHSRDRMSCELFVAEGKSAASGLIASRDSSFQAVFGVRGKIINARKSSVESLLKNQEVCNIIQALGLDCDSRTGRCKYDAKKLRYGRIIAAADGDPDGYAIESLLFNLLWFICPELIKNGHVYSAEPPLFRVTTKDGKYVYLRDEAALEAYRASGKSIKQINRAKGLGEQDSDELARTILNPETRNVSRLTVSDVERTADMFDVLYGRDVHKRVKFLDDHLDGVDVANTDI